MRDLNIALLQCPLQWHAPAVNRTYFSARLAEVEQADLIILPEMFTTGFTMDAAEQAEPVDGASLEWLRTVAADRQAVVTGSVAVKTDAGCCNRLYWVRPDGSFAHYDKRHLFALAGEHQAYLAGRERLIVELHGWRICPQICYDLRFPVWSRNRNDYDLLLYVANWPDKRRQHWIKLLQARAIENQSWCVGVNRIGSDANGVHYAGDSLVCDPLGEVVADAGDKEQLIQLSLSAVQLVQVRSQLPFLRDADDFQLREPDQPERA